MGLFDLVNLFAVISKADNTALSLALLRLANESGSPLAGAVWLWLLQPVVLTAFGGGVLFAEGLEQVQPGTPSPSSWSRVNPPAASNCNLPWRTCPNSRFRIRSRDTILHPCPSCALGRESDESHHLQHSGDAFSPSDITHPTAAREESFPSGNMCHSDEGPNRATARRTDKSMEDVSWWLKSQKRASGNATDSDGEPLEDLPNPPTLEKRASESQFQVPGRSLRGNNRARPARYPEVDTTFIGLHPRHGSLRPFSMESVRSMHVRTAGGPEPWLAGNHRPRKPTRYARANSAQEFLQRASQELPFAKGRLRQVQREDIKDIRQMGILINADPMLDLYGLPASICWTDCGWVVVSDDFTSYALLGRTNDEAWKVLNGNYSTWQWEFAPHPGGVADDIDLAQSQ